MNIANLPKPKQIAIQDDKRACLSHYYANMDKGQALRIKGQLQPRNSPTAKSKVFVERVNKAKGRIFI